MTLRQLLLIAVVFTAAGASCALLGDPACREVAPMPDPRQRWAWIHSSTTGAIRLRHLLPLKMP